MTITIYSAGAMEHLSQSEMEGWRHQAEAALPDVKFLHPTRRKPIHDQLELDSVKKLKELGFDTIEKLQELGFDKVKRETSLETFSRLKRIVAQDLIDIRNSDLILVNLKDSEPGKKWGSVMEVALAWEWGKPIIAIVDSQQFKHPFIYTMCTEVHYNLEDAIEAVKEYY